MNKRLQIHSIFTVLLVVVVFASCDENNEIRHPSLIVYQNATNINHTVKDTAEQISYRIKSKYPAENFIEWLTLELESQGWTPLKESFLNPGIQASINRGWGSYIDGTIEPNEKVHLWMTDWTNTAGDILTYGLRYKYPKKGKKDLKTLYVFGNFITKEIASETLKILNIQK